MQLKRDLMVGYRGPPWSEGRRKCWKARGGGWWRGENCGKRMWSLGGTGGVCELVEDGNSLIDGYQI